MATITIYSTPSCPFCVQAKEFMQSKGVTFEEKDVTKNPAWVQEMIQKSGQTGVPVIEVDGKIIIGFDRVRLTELLVLSKAEGLGLK